MNVVPASRVLKPLVDYICILTSLWWHWLVLDKVKYLLLRYVLRASIWACGG